MALQTAVEADHWLIVANPAAGSVDSGAVDAALAACREYGVRTTVRRTEAAGQAGGLATADLAEPAGVVLVLGGDGTTREVAQALSDAGSSAVLLTSGLGTGNSFHRAVWGERPWQECAADVVAGRSRVRRIDLMAITGSGRSSLLGASTGFIAEVTRLAAEQRGVAGRDRYLGAIGELAADPPIHSGRITVDGRVLYEGGVLTATAGGARHRVGVFQILPRSVLDDGLLDVCVIAAPATAADRDALIPHVLAGTHLDLPGVHFARGTQVTFERLDTGPLVFEHDGEVWDPPGSTVRLDALPGAVAVAAPQNPPAG